MGSVVSANESNRPESLLYEMTYYVSSGT